MNDTIQIIGGAMRAEADALRVIGQNVANSETVAYRRQVAVSHVQFDSLLSDAPPTVLHAPAPQVAIDLRTATLKSTNEPLHVALDGPGFLVVESPQGQLLTRRGDFHVGADGTLVAASGNVVLGEKGSIQIGSALPTISTDGVVSINGSALDQLRVVNITANARLESLGDGTFRVAADAIEEGDRPAIRQGFLESSNVMPVNEMVQLMETVRRFETEQKFALTYHGMLNSAISELGKVE